MLHNCQTQVASLATFIANLVPENFPSPQVTAGGANGSTYWTLYTSIFRMSHIKYEIILAKSLFNFGDGSTALAHGLNYSQLMHWAH